MTGGSWGPQGFLASCFLKRILGGNPLICLPSLCLSVTLRGAVIKYLRKEVLTHGYHQEAERDGCSWSAQLALLIHSGMLAYGKASSIFRMSVPTSIPSLWELPPWTPWECFPWWFWTSQVDNDNEPLWYVVQGQGFQASWPHSEAGIALPSSVLVLVITGFLPELSQLSPLPSLHVAGLHWHPKWEMDLNDLWVSFLWEQRGVSQVDSESLSSFRSFYGIKIYTYLSGLLFYSIKIPYFTLLFSQSWPKWSSVPSCKLWHDDTMHDSAGELVLPWGVGTCLTLPQSDNCALWQISDSVHSFYSW